MNTATHTIIQEQEEEQQEQAVPETSAPLQPSFLEYIWKDKWNRSYLLFALAASIIQFILFKMKYPYANYMPDSYSYLDAAYANFDVNMWPVAYSKFLRLVSVFTHSDKLLTGLQYLLIQGSTLLFLFTLFYMLQPGKAVKNILFLFFVFNPVTLYISNYISADALFIALSLLWFTQLIWILYRPKAYYIYIQGILLLAVFTVRYNAIYYPLIMALCFLLCQRSWKFKISGMGLGLILILFSVLVTSSKMQEITGKRQFSAFGGWQLANNALYMYETIPTKERKSIPIQFFALEVMVREHMDTLHRVHLTHEDTLNAHFYLWNDNGPLIQYMNRSWMKDTTVGYFQKWASEAPLYASYGTHLIREYPMQFAKAFLLPNAERWAVPPVEFIGDYNMGKDSVGKVAKAWFNYKSARIKKGHITDRLMLFNHCYPIFAALANTFFLLSLIGWTALSGIKRASIFFQRQIIIVFTFWGINTSFSIFASPIVLRYQLFPIIISFVFALLLTDILLKTEN